MVHSVAVDARPLSLLTTGIGRNTESLLSRMIEKTVGRIDWYLYSHQPLKVDFSGLSNVTVRADSFSGSLIGSLWAQCVYPVWAVKDGIDLFWSPRHHLPLFLPKDICKVVTINDLVWIKHPDTMQRLGRLLESLLMPRSVEKANRIVCISESTKRDVIEFFPGISEKVSTIYCGAARLEKEHSNDRLAFEKPFMLFVGTLEPRKNLLRLLKAFKTILDNGCTSHDLLIVGGIGWGGQDLHRIVEQSELREAVKILGYVDDMELHALYRAADFLVMPSLFEGFGLPLVEAMSYGVPVITSNISSMPEVAGDGGLLVDPESIGEIATAIKRLIVDRKLRQSLSERAKVQAEKFSWQKSADDTLALFEQCFN